MWYRSNGWGFYWDLGGNFPIGNISFDINTAQINHSPHFSIHFTLALIHWTCELTQLIHALTKTKNLSEESFSFFCKFSYKFSLYFSIYFSFLCDSALLSSLNLLCPSKIFLGMGRFAHLVDSEKGLENFRAQYRILLGVAIRYCKEG